MAVDTDTARGLLMLRLSPATVTADTAVATMARGLLMPSLRLRPRLSPDMAMAATDVDTVATAVDMVVMATAVAITARGLLMLSPRLMQLLWLSLAMATTAVDTVVMAVAMAAMAATARGRLRLSPATATAVDTAAMAVDTEAMAVDTAMVATARGLLSPAMAMA